MWKYAILGGFALFTTNIRNKKMKKLTSVLLSVIITVSTLFGSTLTASANEITPYLYNGNEATVVFGIDSTGIARFAVDYSGKEATFIQAEVSVEIQKRTLLLFWSTVDIGEYNNVWIGYASDLQGYIEKSFQLSSKGTYRAVYTLKFYGTGEATDVIENTIEAKYN